MIKITHHVDFDFKDRDASDLEKLNSILADLKLEKLTLGNERTYLAIMRDDDDNLLGKRYGLDSLHTCREWILLSDRYGRC